MPRPGAAPTPRPARRDPSLLVSLLSPHTWWWYAAPCAPCVAWLARPPASTEARTSSTTVCESLPWRMGREGGLGCGVPWTRPAESGPLSPLSSLSLLPCTQPRCCGGRVWTRARRRGGWRAAGAAGDGRRHWRPGPCPPPAPDYPSRSLGRRTWRRGRAWRAGVGRRGGGWVGSGVCMARRASRDRPSRAPLL